MSGSLSKMPTIFKLRLAVLCLVSISFWLLIALSASPATKLPMLVLEQPANAPESVLQISADVLSVDASGSVTSGDDAADSSSSGPLTVALGTPDDTTGSMDSSNLGSDSGLERAKRRLKRQDIADASHDLSGVDTSDSTYAGDSTESADSDYELTSSDPSTTDNSYGSGGQVMEITAIMANGSYDLVFNWQQGCAWDDYAAMWDCSDNWQPCPDMAHDTPATLALGDAIDHLSMVKDVFAVIPTATAFAGVAMLQLAGGLLLQSRPSGTMLAKLLNHSGLQLALITLATLNAIVGWCAGIAGVILLSGTQVSVSDYTTPPKSKLGGAWYLLLVICLLLCSAVIVSWTVYVRQAREAVFLQMGSSTRVRGAAALYAQDAEKARDTRLSTIQEREEETDDDFAVGDDADEKDASFFSASVAQGRL